MYRVFSRPFYVFFAFGVALLLFLGVFWYADFPLAIRFLFDSRLTASQAFSFSYGLLGGALSTQSPAYLAYTALMALMTGMNAALLSFYIRLYRSAPSFPGLAGGFLGMFFAILGFSCASCGTVFLSALSLAAAGLGLYALSPLIGIGIGMLGIALLALSMYFLVRAINTPPVCPI